MVGQKLFAGILNLFVLGYLARLVSKEEFGVIAISRVLLSFVGSVGLSGLTEYIIYYQGNNKKEIYNSTFWLNLFLATFLSLLIFISAPYLANYYEDNRITNIIYLLTITFFFGALSSIPLSLFKKEIRFKEIILPKFFIGTITQLSMLMMAYLGYGIYSIVVPPVFATLITCIYYYYISSFTPILNRLGIKHWSSIFSYTKFIILNLFFSKVTNEADTLIIGKKLDLKSLGLYDLSFVFSNLFYNNSMPMINNITFPIFSKNQNDLDNIRNYLSKMILSTSFLYIPLTVFLILAAPISIEILYGPKWADMVMPYQILSIYIIFRCVSAPASSLYNALGKPIIGTYYNLIFAPSLIIGIYYMTQYGLITTCIYIVVIRCLGSLYHLYKIKSLISFNFLRTWQCIKLPLICSVTSYFLINSLIVYYNNELLSILFPLVYIICALVFYKTLFISQIIFLKSFINKKYLS